MLPNCPTAQLGNVNGNIRAAVGANVVDDSGGGVSVDCTSKCHGIELFGLQLRIDLQGA